MHYACPVLPHSQLLNVLEFNSTRKRMSVVVRDDQGKLLLFCKVRVGLSAGAGWGRHRVWGRQGVQRV